MDAIPLWAVATVAAAAAQTGRNAMQHRLTEALGTAGATQVRFLYGLPFAALFLAVLGAAGVGAPPAPDGWFLVFVTGAAVAQILATGLMLSAMRLRSFAVTIAYTKAEPVQVALFGLAVLGDPLTPAGAAAILVATAGIVLLSLKPGAVAASSGADRILPAVLGLASAACFAVAAVGFRGAILALEDGGFLIRATTTLVWSLAIQSGLLMAWLLAFDRAALLGSLRVWRDSLTAGALGALASQLWFLGFALTTAANVRTLGLVEVLFAAVVSRRVFSQAMTRREGLGLLLVVVGVGLLLAGAA